MGVFLLEETTENLNIHEEKPLAKEDGLENKVKALKKLDSLIDSYINSPETLKKGNNLSYWISQYCTAISFENNFNPKKLKSYKRGDVIKVHLGFNIGNELGGLHYCVVLDCKNAMGSGTITVIPLTSSKENKTYHNSTVNLGNEVYLSLKKKFEKVNARFIEEATEIMKLKEQFDTLDEVQRQEYIYKLNKTMEDLAFVTKLENEIERMKQGSIALVGQITTISKQRIYDPQTYKDIMSGIKLSSNSLSLIDNKIKELFMKNI